MNSARAARAYDSALRRRKQAPLRSDNSTYVRSTLLSVGEGALLLSGLVVVLGVLLAVTFVRPETSVYFVCFTLLTALLAVPLVTACVTRRFDPFEPATILAASYFLYFVYAPARSLRSGDYYFFGKSIMPLLPEGSLYVGLGIVGLWAGYYCSRVARNFARSVPSPPESYQGVVPYAWIVAAVAVVAFNTYAHLAGLSWVRLLSLGQLGSAPRELQSGLASAGSAFRNYLYSTLDWLTSALMLLYAFSRRGRKWLAVAFIAVLLIYTTIGFRFRVVVLLLAPVIYHYLKLRRRPGVVKIAVAAGGMMLLIGAIGMSRRSFRAGQSVEPGSISISSSSESFSGDLDLYQGYLAIVDAFPVDHDYLWGSSFAYLFLQPIPRSLWPDKPEAPVATIIDATLGSEAAKAGIAYPNVGEFFANFGPIGVIACMWLFGFLTRAMYEYLRLNESNEWARVLYAVSFPFLVQVISRGYFVAIVQEAAFLVMPLVIGMWICRRPILRPPRRELKSESLASALSIPPHAQ